MSTHAPPHVLLLQTVLGVPWSHISWLNPEIPADTAEVEGGTAICTENGPTPESVVPAPEPGGAASSGP